jgi:hypothetical protein
MNIQTNKIRRDRSAGDCGRYTSTPVHLLKESEMCIPDLYTFIKLYGKESHVQELVGLRALRRKFLLPIYRDVIRNPQRLPSFFGRTDLPPLPVVVRA